MTDDVSPMSSFKNVILEVDGEEGTESSYESSVKQID